jgi:hypothetical protein
VKRRALLSRADSNETLLRGGRTIHPVPFQCVRVGTPPLPVGVTKKRGPDYTSGSLSTWDDVGRIIHFPPVETRLIASLQMCGNEKSGFL